ncbi:coronin-1A-like isoform X2 [Physella acuta]|uniref:coronin-1A-like isoform X2 n=1 Tax=Physella acuta TaxID=109671 RepID=UPI0027DE5B7F|nr:coronin-1A-like isoform X2 [Physella acuta]
MALRLRSSKFRHVFGSQCRREHTFENVRITRNTHDSNFCSVNPRFLAIVTESSGGGSFAILDVNRPGRVDVNCPKVCGHAGAVLDVKWSPFNDCIIASGSDDATVKVWTIPDAGLLGTLTDWSADLHGHSRRVAYVDWHTSAANILMSVGFDFKIMIWNVEQAEPITCIDSHSDTIYSASWGRDGSLIASTCKDKKIRIMDPRLAKVAVEFEGHQSTKTSKVVFVSDNQIFTTGFSRASDRQYALWDVRKSGHPLSLTDIDCASGILLPYYDADTKVVYLAGKGDGNIRYFEIDTEESEIYFLNTYQSALPQRGLGMMPKRGIDPFKNEVARFYKLHASKNLVEPISMIVPRKAEGFQHDVYPPTASTIPSLTADEWTSGINRGPILINLENGTILDKPRVSMSSAVQPQLSSLSKPPQITTYRAINRTAAPFSAAPPTTQRISPEGHAPVVFRTPSPMSAPSQWNGSEKHEPASIKNIRRLSGHREDGDSDSSVSSSTPGALTTALTTAVTTAHGRPSPASLPLASSHVVHHVNGHTGDPSAGDHLVSSSVSSSKPVSSSRFVQARFGRSNGPQRANTISGGAEHVSAVQMVIGQPSATSHTNLKKAYFRQLEEIASLQEQLQVKDRRIKQLEMELSHMRERESDLRPGESNC